MAQAGVDDVAAVKASLELLVAENDEIHEYFRDLLDKVSELEDAAPEQRREQFRELESMGAFRFNGLDVRHFTQSQQRPLPPPVFLNRTRRRLKNTLTLVDEFERRGVLADADALRESIDRLAMHIVDGEDNGAVRAFRDEVTALRESAPFRAYMQTKAEFIRQDADVRTDAAYLAAKETVEDGEETFRQRGVGLESLSRDIERGAVPLDEAQARLDGLQLAAGTSGTDGADAPQPDAAAGEADVTGMELADAVGAEDVDGADAADLPAEADDAVTAAALDAVLDEGDPGADAPDQAPEDAGEATAEELVP